MPSMLFEQYALYVDNPKISPIYVVRELLGLKVRLAQGMIGRERSSLLTWMEPKWLWVDLILNVMKYNQMRFNPPISPCQPQRMVKSAAFFE